MSAAYSEPHYVACLVTSDEKIVFAGKKEDAANFWDMVDKKVVDLDGKCLMPGFIDPHIHPSMAGYTFNIIIKKWF